MAGQVFKYLHHGINPQGCMNLLLADIGFDDVFRACTEMALTLRKIILSNHALAINTSSQNNKKQIPSIARLKMSKTLCPQEK